jgi:cytochrome c556
MNLRISLSWLGVLALLTGVAAGQTPRTGKLMREKLAHSQKILEALTTSNHDLLIREADALSRIAASPQWTADLRTPELRGYAESFTKTVADLTAAARRRDLDSGAAHYNTMVTACYQCHKHLKDSRIAK